MNEINYNDWLNKTICDLKNSGNTPTLLLHACCAPCSSGVLYKIAQYFKITILWYNPNINVKNENEIRFNELKKLVNDVNNHIGSIKTAHDIDIMFVEQEKEKFFEITKCLENLKEGDIRCEKCFYQRLSKTCEIAKQKNFDYFSTTLTISPYKNAKLLNTIGESLQKQYGVKYLFSDFKKENGYQNSIKLSKEYNLYRQNYCGCVYSFNEMQNKTNSNIL